MIKKILLSILLIFIFSCSDSKTILDLETDSILISLNDTGSITRILDKINNQEILSHDTTSYLISLKNKDGIISPLSVSANNENQILTFGFPNNIEASVRYSISADYIKFELTQINNGDIELVIWGPYPTKLNKVIGETIGVVQGENIAFGLQALNAKTLGGYPWTDNDCMPQINIFAQNDYTDLSEEGKEYVLYRVEAAKPTKYGSSLQAYCRNRNEERIIENLDHEFYFSPKYEDGGIIGSSIALFGCEKENILNTISKIEKNENLPHPMLEGEWNKTSKAASRAYIIYDFSESSIDKAIMLTQKAGLKYLYQGNPFETWGKFELSKKNFPNGINGLKSCIEKANKNGIQVGLHTLSNFITPNDKYVSPIPDQRLGKVGSSIITEAINKSQKEIKIEDPKFFNQFKNNSMKTVMVDQELIRYGSVAQENNEWYLKECERGAFNTKAASHEKGIEIIKLADHAYKVFLTNPDLSLEVSKNLADLFNQTGLRQISFDGLEGNRSTGMGNYGEILFVENWYNNLNGKIKESFIADASRTTHYFWHIYTRMNWGEPWYAGFRESQTEYRLKNQAYFKRNLMPRMLGWFQLRPETSTEDIEWMLARSAAFDAGYAFVLSDNSINANKNTDQIFNLIGTWEEARLSDIFSDEQKQKMEDIKNEFTLKKVSDGNWEWNQVYSNKFIHNKKVRQPGEPLFSTFNFINPTENEEVHFILKAVKSDLSKITFEIDNFKKIELPITLKKDEILKYSGGDKAIVYKSNWEKVSEINLNKSDWKLKKGDHQITFDCIFNGDDESQAKLEIRMFDNPVIVKK
ncbi:MAG: hypothetical protein H6610_01870 [Ignavibacteriales bacterium]|nr:hypothetical protein [Ignavibacteriales bacterium]